MTLTVAVLLAAIMTCDGAKEDMAVATSATATIGASFWRIRSITKAPGEYWQIAEIEFCDSKGTPITNIKKAIASSYKDSPAPGKPDKSQFKAAKAIDGKLDTHWSASNNNKFEFLAVEFTMPVDIRSIKCQLTNDANGPAMVIIEKSSDGENWSRSTEISDMKKWGSKMEAYPLLDMDFVPFSVFSLRSQVNPWFCVGIKPTPNPDPELEPIAMKEGASLEVQVCSDANNHQYWTIDEETGLLQNAADMSMVIKANELQDGGLLSINKYECKESGNACTTISETCICPQWARSSKFGFLEGLLGSRVDGSRNLIIKLQSLAAGAAVTLATCGADGSTNAAITNCGSEQVAQFELNPMFIVEPKKQALACAPYSNSKLEPTPASTEFTAMKLCAAKASCTAYNWASQSAVCTAEPPCEGKYKASAWLCTDMHEVYSDVEGWSLGTRAGKLAPFVE